MSAFDNMAPPPAGLELDVAARLSASIDQLNETMRRPRFPPPAAPSFFRDTHQAVLDANGRGIINMRGPTMGFMWYVRQLAIAGTDPTLAVLGQADLFVSAARLTGTTPPTSDWVDRANRLPNNAFYGRGELELRHNETLLIFISAGTSGQAVAATFKVENIQEAAGKQEWGL